MPIIQKTSPEILIRPAIIADKVYIVSLLQTSNMHLRDQGILQWHINYPDPEIIENDIKNGTAFVALYNQNIIGTIVLDENQDSEYDEVPWQFTGKSVAILHRFIVHPFMQGQGIGRTCIKFIEHHALNAGYQIIRFDTFTQNLKALQFYESLGYRNAGKLLYRMGYFYCFEKKLA
ncbi:MAG: GNAT family N-acetyltransferase [Pseudomonadota bacterium]